MWTRLESADAGAETRDRASNLQSSRFFDTGIAPADQGHLQMTASPTSRNTSGLLDELDRSAFARLQAPKVTPWRVPGRLAYVVSHSYPFSTNGYAVRTHGVASALVERGHSVVVVSRPGRPWDLPGFSDRSFPGVHVIDGVRYLHLQQPSSSGMQQYAYFDAAARALYETLRVFKPGAVMAASNWENAVPAIAAARRLGLPFHYEVRGFWEITRASQESGYAETEAFRTAVEMESMVARAADRVFTLNDPMRSELVRRGVEPERIVLMPNAHRGARPSALSAAAAKAKVGSKARHLIGYVGSFSAYEGLDDLVDACAKLRREGLDIDLLLVGSSNPLGVDESPDRCPVCASMRAAADRQGLGSHLILTGRRAADELPDLYAAIDVVVVPRRPVPVSELVPPFKL